MSNEHDDLPSLEPKSSELTELVEFARSDLPSDEQWAALTAQMANIWQAPPTAGGDPLEGPISGVSPAAKAASGGGKAAVGAGVGLPAAVKVAGVAVLSGALASGLWFAAKPAPLPESKSVASAPSQVEPAPEGQTPPATVLPETPAVDVSQAGAEASLAAREPAPKTQATLGPSKAPPSELRLLTQARDQLGKNPQQSLALCREHQRRYPQGQLAQEREVLMIEALTRLRRDQEASQRRNQFGKTFPDSPHQSRVKQGTDNPTQ